MSGILMSYELIMKKQPISIPTYVFTPKYVINDTINSNELNTDRINSNELNTDCINSNELNTDRINSNELNTDCINSNELNMNNKKSTE